MTNPMTPTAGELAACPFCGGRAITHRGSLPQEWAVSCTQCDCRPRIGWPKAEAEAITAWNQRPTQDGPSAEVERVARAIAKSCFVDLSVAIGEAGGITNAVAIFGMDEISDDPRYRDWRISSCRGVLKTATAAIQAMRPTAATVNKAMLEALKSIRQISSKPTYPGNNLRDIDLIAQDALARGDA